MTKPGTRFVYTSPSGSAACICSTALYRICLELDATRGVKSQEKLLYYTHINKAKSAQMSQKCLSTKKRLTLREARTTAVYRIERERDSTNAVPPHLRRDVSSVIQAVWPPRVAVLFQFGRALREGSVIREHSPGRSRCSGNPTDVRPRDASLVVSQALWICSAAGGTT